MNILLKAATIVDQGNKEIHLKKRDILIKNGIIDTIAAKINPSGKTKTIESKNLHISVGWFDSSVSFGEPGYEERETITNGLLTAAKSGFTDIVLNPNTNPAPDSSSVIVFPFLSQPSFAASIVFDVAIAFAFARRGDTEIEFLDVLVVREFVGGAIHHDTPVFHHIGIVRDRQRRGAVLLDQEKGRPFGFELPKHRVDIPDHHRGEPERWLVNGDDLGFRHHGATDQQQLLLATGHESGGSAA